MILITIVTWAYKPTYNGGASHCRPLDPLTPMPSRPRHMGDMGGPSSHNVDHGGRLCYHPLGETM